MKITHTAYILFFSVFCCTISTSHAYTKQEIINALTQSGQAYWEQRVVIEHSSTGKTLFGFSGAQTVKEEGVPRYYDTDGTFVSDPHIFVEAEDSKGPAGVLFAYVKAYEATGNKFFLRSAKSLGDTFIQAQIDNNTGGWWHDMGVIADGVDQGKFVNYFPWGGSVHADPEYQHIGDNDGASYLQATALLRLEQALPAEDPDKGGKYLASAKWYADTLVALKDVTLVRGGTTYHPYGNGGIPQMFPFATLTDGRRPVDFCKNCTFPDDYPEGFQEYSHNIMVTLNDDAMLGAVIFLGEFAQEAKTNPGLDEMTYLNAGRLNIDYLLDRFTAFATPNGNSAWATAYYIQDGSPNAGKPTWLRSMEPPGFYAQSSADDILVYWYKNVETDPARLAAINSTMAKHALFWKNDAMVINGDQVYLDIVAGDHTGVDAGSDPVLTGPARNWTKTDAGYDPDNAHTWYFWYVANHDPAAGVIGLPVSGPDSLKCKAIGDNCYNRTVGLSAVYRRNLTNGDFYSYSEAGYPPLIGSSMGTSPPSHEIAMFLDEANNGYNWDHNYLKYFHAYEPDRRFFYKHPYSSSKVDGAFNDLDAETKFFVPRTATINGTVYSVIYDNFFTERVSALSWGIDNGATGEVVDSDGDGYSDTEETIAHSDMFDSESVPGETSSIHEDAENGNILGWKVYDNTPAGAIITNVNDNSRGSRVIEFTGAGAQNGYRLYKDDDTPWNNTDQTIIEWSMKYSESFVVYIAVQTTNGFRYVYYTTANQDYLGTGTYIHHGLGATAKDGNWHTFTRNLEYDLQEAQPNNSIEQILGFFIRGSGRVDDIQTLSTSPAAMDIDGDGISDYDEMEIYGTNIYQQDTDEDGLNDGVELSYWGAGWNEDIDNDGIINLLDADSDGDGFNDGIEIDQGTDPADASSVGSGILYEDAEDGTIAGWNVYDNTPDGATITNVQDDERNSRVIEFSGSGTSNGFKLTNTNGSWWNNPAHKIIEWSMKYSESFVVYIAVQTTDGFRYVYYTTANQDYLGTGTYIHHGLSASAKDGNWHTFTRNLEADLKEAQPDNDLEKVLGFFIRGSGRIDNIELLAQ